MAVGASGESRKERLALKRFICAVALFVFGFAFPASAELSGRYEGWADGPVRWLLTDEELTEWKTIDNDSAAREFIELFWARRDPTPSTAVNEMRSLYRERGYTADERFSVGEKRGHLTDRGRVLLLIGPPNSISRTPRNARGAQPPVETWFYEGEHRPAVTPERDLTITFIDEYGTGDFRISMIGRSRIEEILEKTRMARLLQPELDAVPEYPSQEITASVAEDVELEPVLTEFRSDYLRKAYEEFRQQSGTGDHTIHLTYGQFITPRGQPFVPVQLYVPGSSGLDTAGELTFFGVVETRDGEIVAVYEEPALLTVSGTDAYYDKSLILGAGEYVGTFGLAKNGAPIAIRTIDLALAPLVPGRPDVSRVILSNNMHSLLERKTATDPFTFGGLKVVPKGDLQFDTRDEIWYFAELRNPGIDENGRGRILVQLDVRGETVDGEPVKMSAPLSEAAPQPIRNAPGRYVLGSSIRRGALAPGSYVLEVQVVDDVSKNTWRSEQEFRVVE